VDGDEPRPDAPSGRAAAHRPLAWLCAAYALAALWILAPAQRGEFVSDDLPNVLYNPYVHALSLPNLREILDPGGDVAANTYNYAPVHMLALALEWRAFGADVRGYHVVNALVHAVAAALLAALLTARGLPLAAAALAGALFLVHPANVEASAWIFQIKTTGALALSLGALLLHPRRPALALGLFALALLTKASAAFALPMAAVFSAQDRDPRGAWRSRAAWLVAWLALLVPYAFLELRVLGRMQAAHAPLHPDAVVSARTVVGLAGRYLRIAATGTGVSPGHELAPALSWLDPWWLAGAAGLAALASRTAFALRARREEAAWWVGAAAAYLPVAQIGVSFIQPMADHYLYFALPGLIGGIAFAARDAWRRLGASEATTARAARAAAALMLAVIAAFAVRSHADARHWRSGTTLAIAAAAAYPEGLAAQLLAANQAAMQGDAARTVAALRAAMARGYDRFDAIAESPAYDSVRGDPAFQDLVRDAARQWIEASRTLAHPTQADLSSRAEAYLILDDLEHAAAALDDALRMGGPLDASLRAQRAALRLRMQDSAPGRP
jgi:hypothetical protein